MFARIYAQAIWLWRSNTLNHCTVLPLEWEWGGIQIEATLITYSSPSCPKWPPPEQWQSYAGS